MTEHDHRDEPVVMTTPDRMIRGIIIVGVTLVIGAIVTVTQFDNFFSVPPLVSQIPPDARPPPPVVAGVTTITILQGSAIQGNPDYDPDPAEVPVGNKVVWVNVDNVPHTSTSGTGPADPNSGVRFDTGLLAGGESSEEITIDAKVGEIIPYYCIVHPYMISELIFVEAEEGNGNMLTMLAGSAIQGNPAYSPDPMIVTVGDVITAFNADNVPHTVTSGTGPADPQSGQLFDTGIVIGGESATIDTSGLAPGTYDYYCLVHPYMVGKLQVTE